MRIPNLNLSVDGGQIDAIRRAAVREGATHVVSVLDAVTRHESLTAEQVAAVKPWLLAHFTHIARITQEARS